MTETQLSMLNTIPSHGAFDIRCTKCGEYKPRDRFSSTTVKRNGLQSWCRDCHNEHVRNRDALDGRRRSRESARVRDRAAKYGVTIEQRNQM